MPCMYFSGKEGNATTIDDPNNRCISVNTELYARVRNNNEQTQEPDTQYSK